MNAFARPLPTKLAAAIVAAGIATTGAVLDVSDERDRSPITAEVANASIITDALYSFGDVVSGLAAGIAIPADAGLSLPFDTATAVLIASQSPSLAPNLLSWLVQRYTNPSDTYPWYSYPWDFEETAIEPVVGALLPPALATAVMDAVNQLGIAIGDALEGALPDSAPGVAATDAFWQTDIGRTLVAANLAVLAPVYVLWDIVDYLAYVPAELEATVESAIQNPAEIPGLLSYLAYGLLGTSGLLGSLISDVTAPLTELPGPVGQLASDFTTVIENGINDFLSLLPPPIVPTPFVAPVTTLVDVTTDTSEEPQVESLTPEVDVDAATDPQGQEPEQLGTDEVEIATAPAVDDDTTQRNTQGAGTNMKTGNKFVPGSTVADEPDTADSAEPSPSPEPGAGIDPVGGETADAEGDQPAEGETGTPDNSAEAAA